MIDLGFLNDTIIRRSKICMKRNSRLIEFLKYIYIYKDIFRIILVKRIDYRCYNGVLGLKI